MPFLPTDSEEDPNSSTVCPIGSAVAHHESAACSADIVPYIAICANHSTAIGNGQLIVP